MASSGRTREGTRWRRVGGAVLGVVVVEEEGVEMGLVGVLLFVCGEV